MHIGVGCGKLDGNRHERESTTPDTVVRVLHEGAEAMLAMVGVRNISTRALVRNLSVAQQARGGYSEGFRGGGVRRTVDSR